jgi:hypothetical protein
MVAASVPLLRRPSGNELQTDQSTPRSGQRRDSQCSTAPRTRRSVGSRGGDYCVALVLERAWRRLYYFVNQAKVRSPATTNVTRRPTGPGKNASTAEVADAC